MGAACRLQPQLARDDRQLDLRRPLGDRHEPRVPPEALDGELRDVPVAAEHLHRLPRDALGHLRGEELGHRRLAHRVALVEEPCGTPHRRARRLHLHRHARQLELDRWNLAMGWPNCSRSLAYLTAASSAAWLTPTERAACVMRPPSSVPVTCLKPPSTPPSSAAAGTCMSSKESAAVSEV